MQKYTNMLYNDKEVYPIMVPDPTGALYKKYEIDRSMGKLLSAMFLHGGFSTMNAGKKLFTEKIIDDAPADIVPADFLIDEKGNIVNAHYGKYSGDHITVSDIKKFISE